MNTDIVPAGAERLDDYSDLFARTFADDALITWPLPAGDAEYLARKRFIPLGRGMMEAGSDSTGPGAMGRALSSKRHGRGTSACTNTSGSG